MSWITVPTSSGTGNRAVSYSVAINTSNNYRSGTLFIAGQSFTIEQAGVSGSCTVAPIAAGQTLSSALNDGDCRSRVNTSSTYYSDRYSFSATAGQEVAISLTSSFSPNLYLIDPGGSVIAGSSSRLPSNGFLSLPSSGTYTIEVTSNFSFGSGDYTLNLNVASAGCGYVIAPAGQTFDSSGRTGSVRVTAAGGCTWTASSSVNWVTISAGGSGSGDGMVSFSVATNTSSSYRSGTLLIAGQSFTIEQAGDGGNCVVTPLTGGQMMNGNLSSSDCRSRIRTSSTFYADRYSFTATAGDKVTISMTSSSFTPSLSLINPNGAVLSQNSASEGARIPPGGFYILPLNGTYIIEATSASSFSTGNYSLSLSVSGSVTSVSAASYNGASLASESIVAAFGSNLATAVQLATTIPLPTSLAGTTVRIRDSAGTERLAPLFFVSPSQINYQIPSGTLVGPATVTVTNTNGSMAIGTVQIDSVSPGLFTVTSDGQGLPVAIVRRFRNNQELPSVMAAQLDAQNRWVPIPIDLGPDTDLIILEMYGTGFRFLSSLATVTVKIGGADGQIFYAGLAPGFVGLDQVDVAIPRSLIGRGDVDIVFTVDGKMANTVKVNIR